MFNYELLRSKRKSLTLTVDVKGRLIVKAPPRLPVSEIEKFIELKKKWIAGRTIIYPAFFFAAPHNYFPV